MIDGKDGLFDLPADEAEFFDSKGEKAPAEAPAAEEPAALAEPAQTPPEAPAEPVNDDDEHEEQERPRGDLSKAVVEKNRQLSQLKREKRELETKQATLNGRLEILERLAKGLPLEQQQPQKPQPIDPDADPLGAIKALAQEVPALKQQLEQRQVLDQQAEQERQFVAAYNQAADEFTKQTPDFPDAYRHLVEGRVKELELIGHDQATINQIVKAEELMIVNTALQQGRNPIETIYAVAKQRGFTKAAPSQPATQPANDAVRVEAMNKAEKATKTLSNAPGVASSTPTLDALVNMSETEFAEATAGGNWRKLLGA